MKTERQYFLGDGAFRHARCSAGLCFSGAMLSVCCLIGTGCGAPKLEYQGLYDHRIEVEGRAKRSVTKGKEPVGTV